MITFQILCPKKKCRKCVRLQKFLEKLIVKQQLDAEIVYVSELSEMLEYKTWLLPSPSINKKAVARGGYLPRETDILLEIKSQKKALNKVESS